MGAASPLLVRRRAIARQRWMTSLWAGVALSVASPVCAQEQPSAGLDVQLFAPPASLGATFTIADPQVLPHLTFDLGLSLDYAGAPLRRQALDGGDESVVAHRGEAALLFALGLVGWLELELALPVSMVDGVATSEVQNADLSRSLELGIGDPRVAVKATLLSGEVQLATRVVASIPIGADDRFLGAGAWTFWPELIVGGRVGPLRLVGALGWRFVEAADLGAFERDDELTAALGADLSLHASVSLIGEARGRFGLAGRSRDADEMPAEVDLGLRWRASGAWVLDVGVGRGLSRGYGSPAIRGFAILRYRRGRAACPAGAEDPDGFEDGDFCLDPDNDQDGIDDAQDRCVNDAEDLDGFLDEDGCPDLDNDADGLLDDVDLCPTESEDGDGFQDDDGCPEPDNDEDGVVDGRDRCRMDPEDRDGFQDDDGCPEPGPNAPTVTVTESRILISERIYFDFDTDVIRSVSLPLLDRVAEVITDLGTRQHVRVEGYTDGEGDADYNLDLSYRRARAVVEYLVAKGVPRRRLDYVGYGEGRSVAPDDSPEGRALNRRVEFTIFQEEDNAGRPTRGPRSARPRPRGRTGR